jgi:2-C-methyl-D-erythritol 4-phosphate cytidylyltransferase
MPEFLPDFFNEKCDIVLVAGGSGSRFKSNTPKQFEPINGQPLYLWSLNSFLNWPQSANVCVVVPPDWVEPVQESFKNLESGRRVHVVAGGLTRQDSAYNGVKALSGSDSEWVMIHDAARPAITDELLQRVWEARRLSFASAQIAGVIPGVAAKETIKEVSPHLHHAVVTETLERDRLRVIQTPQLMRRHLLIEAYERFVGEAAVDDASLLEKMGYKIVVVDGDYDNVKVTFMEDRERVSNWLRHRHPPL